MAMRKSQRRNSITSLMTTTAATAPSSQYAISTGMSKTVTPVYLGKLDGSAPDVACDALQTFAQDTKTAARLRRRLAVKPSG